MTSKCSQCYSDTARAVQIYPVTEAIGVGEATGKGAEGLKRVKRRRLKP